MKMKSMGILAALTMVAGLSACTDHSRNDDVNTSNQAPGTIGHMDNSVDKGSVDVKRDVVKHETKTESVPTVEQKMVRADINRMDRDDFVALGLTRDAADSIVKYRDKNGKFNSLEDLRRVPGVNQAWLEQNRSKLGVSAG